MRSEFSYNCGDSYDLTEKRRRENFFRNLAFSWTNNNPANHARKKCPALAKQMQMQMNKYSDVLKAYSKYLVSQNDTSDGICDSGRIKKTMKPAFGDNSVIDGKSWDWQTCNEYGDFQISYNKSNLFAGSWSTAIDVKSCKDEFPDGG